MRFVWLVVMTLALVGGRGLPCFGQAGGLTLELSIDEPNYLPGEDIPVGVRISNLSGRTLTFGATTNWLRFYAETKTGSIVARLGDVPVEGEFQLESSQAANMRWNVQPHFDFAETGTYQVSAELRLPGWNERVLSNPVRFNIQRARNMWEVTFGVPPDPEHPEVRPEIRRYALQAATRTQDRNLYARVTDATGSQIYRVVLLDRLVSFSNPQQQLDQLSRLHVLFQTGGSVYTYCMVGTDGTLLVRQKHEILPGSRPRLMKGDDGSIVVLGGRRLPAPSDIPPYEPPPVDVSAVTNAPPATNAAPADAKGETGRKSDRRKRREATP